jgi:hypothetical protein
MAFLRTLGSALFTRVIVSYRSTLVGLGLAAAIVVVEATTTYLQALPDGWAKAAAAVVALVGAALRSKQVAQPALPPAV